MKRASKITLGLSGLIIALAACSKEPDKDELRKQEHHFQTPEECIGSGIYTTEECKFIWDEATKEHYSTTPHYSTQDNCPHDPGQECVVRRNDDGTEYFVPALLGVAVGAMIGNHFAHSSPLYYGPNNCSVGDYNCNSQRRIYSSTGYFGTINSGSRITSGSGTSFISGRPSMSYSSATSASVSRGGFGSSAAAHAGGGS